MKYDLIIKEEALADIQSGYDYYEDRKKGLGLRFVDNLDDCFERLKLYPYHHQIRRKPYREALLKVFPYLVIYEIEDENIIFFAVFNTSRNPTKKPK